MSLTMLEILKIVIYIVQIQEFLSCFVVLGSCIYSTFKWTWHFNGHCIILQASRVTQCYCSVVTMHQC